MRFEPTPGNGAVIPSYTHEVSVPHVGPGTAHSHRATAHRGLPVGKTPDRRPTTTARSRRHARHRQRRRRRVPPLGWLVLVVVVALALTPASIRWGIRRSRMARAIDGGPSCEFAWLELRDRILDLRTALDADR